jgi:uncharacterized short protein YbdD (DUF466 family)
MLREIKLIYAFLRRLSGDDLYDLYVLNHKQCLKKHKLMNKQQFYQVTLDKKWSGIKRCC